MAALLGVLVIAAALALAGGARAAGGSFVQQGTPFSTPSVRPHGEEAAYRLALSADGSTALVGAPEAGGRGQVYVYTRSATTWTRQQTLEAPLERGGHFGEGVALSADGDTALVGVPRSAEGGRQVPGFGEVFTRSGSTWTPSAILEVGEPEAAEDEFHEQLGLSAALSADGSTALLGGVHKAAEEGEAPSEGAWVFVRSGEGFSQQGANLLGAPATGTHAFGRAAALSGDGSTALVGSIGAASVFTRSGSTWTEQQKLTGPGVFGSSVALSGAGTTALLDGKSAAHVFTRSGEAWTQSAELVGAESEGSGFGGPVALSSDGATALVAGPFAHPAGPGQEGAVWAFKNSGEAWSQYGPRFFGSGGNDEVEEFGSGLALSSDGSEALIGGTQEDGQLWSFKASEASRPTVVTGEATEVTSSTATLNGTVNPNGGEVTECDFYLTGIMHGFPRIIPCSSLPGAGNSPVAVSARINVAPEHPYIFYVVATNALGTSYGQEAGFSSEPLPAITGISPLRGTAAGGTTVTISGQGFSGASDVVFGSTPAASFEVASPTTIRAVSPAAVAGKVDVRVTVEGATSPVTRNDHYTFVPQVTSVSPSSGPEAGGTAVTVTGAGFAIGATTIQFGKALATSVSCSSSTRCAAVSPPHPAGKVKVRAIVNKVHSPMGTVAFTYAP